MTLNLVNINNRLINTKTLIISMYSSIIYIADFKLFILGEGIEVSEKNFSEEVASQLNNTS